MKYDDEPEVYVQECSDAKPYIVDPKARSWENKQGEPENDEERPVMYERNKVVDCGSPAQDC